MSAPLYTRRSLLAASAALGALTLAPHASRAALRVAPGGALRIPMPGAPASAAAARPGAALFDPARAVDLAHAWVLALSHETLAGSERDGYPLLERAPAREPGDARSVLVALRGGMLYASGEPVTAASVAAAWSRARATPLGRLALALCAAQTPFDVAGPYALRVRLALPDTIDELLGAWPLAPAGARNAAGLGPFTPRLDGTALVRNPRAAVGPAYLERVDLLAPRARNDEVRAFATGGADASWRAAGLYEVSRPAQEVRGAPGTGAVVGVVPLARGPLDRADAARALEAVLGAGLTAGTAASATPLPFAPDGARPAPAAAGALLARLAPQMRLARDPLDAFVGALGERVVALLDAVGVRVALVDIASSPAPAAPAAPAYADATLRAVAPINPTDPAFALASFLAVAGDEAGASSIVRAARNARAPAASSAWARSAAAVIGRLTPRLYLRDDLAGAAFDAAGRLHLGDAHVRPTTSAPAAAPAPRARSGAP